MVESSRHANAIVIGGSMAGLMAARVLAEHFARVTLIERDTLAHGPEQRKGVPQGQHVHGLLAGGQRALEGLFPGLTKDLVAEGATSLDVIADATWHQAGGYRLRFASGLEGISLSRPLLEAGISRRVRGLANVAVRDGRAVTGLTASGDRARVTGVTIRRRGAITAGEETLAAELVVDAGGRGGGAPSWLAALGYERPQEEKIVVGVGYTSRLYRRRPGDLPGAKAAICQPTPPHETRIGVLLPVEGDRWIATLAGWLGDHAPADDAGFLAFARSFAAPEIHDVIVRAEPLGDFTTHQFPANLRQQTASVPSGDARRVTSCENATSAAFADQALRKDGGKLMARFTPAEIAYLQNQRLGRLATIDRRGELHVVPVGFQYNAEHDTIDLGGYGLITSKKYRDALAHGRAAFVVDDVPQPGKPRFVEVRGMVQAATRDPADAPNVPAAILRIIPTYIVSIGVNDEIVDPRGGRVNYHGRAVQ